MRNSRSMIQEIEHELKTLADKKIAQHAKGFFKTGKGEYAEGDRFLGIRVPVLRKLVGKYKDIPLPEAALLLKSPFHEERLLALFLLVNRYHRSAGEDQKAVFNLYMKHTPYINNWDLVDSSAEHIAGSYLLDRDKRLIYDFSRSPSLWERRIAIISTFHFIRNNRFDDTLRISEILLRDTEDLIHKAVGWMLREIGKRNMNMLTGFLAIHYNAMPRTMLRYAIEKMPEETRQKYLKGAV